MTSERDLALYFIKLPDYRQKYLRRKYEQQTGKDSTEMYEVNEWLNGSCDTWDFLRWVFEEAGR